MAQTKRDIKALLDSVGIRPLKRFGQNFLIDGNLLRKLVTAADVQADDVVLDAASVSSFAEAGKLLEHGGAYVTLLPSFSLLTGVLASIFSSARMRKRSMPQCLRESWSS